MATFAIIAEHPPDLCPTSNAQTRQILREGAGQIPELAEQLGVNIVTPRKVRSTVALPSAKWTSWRGEALKAAGLRE